MPNARLTDRTVANAKPPAPPKKYAEYWDTILPGFGLRVGAGGKRSFMLQIRVNGKQRRQTLGAYPAMSLTDARDLARQRMDEADRGIDHKRQAVLERHAAERRKAETFEAAAANFIEFYAKPRRRTWHLMERDIRDVFNPVWGSLPVAELTRGDITDLLRAKARTAPVRANRLFSLIRKILNWCVKQELIATNPAASIDPPGGPEKPRQRWLDDDEKILFWNATDALGEPYGSMYKVLALTAQRLSEVSDMEWRELDLAKAEWDIPAERAKRDVPNMVPLAPEVVAILDAMPRVNDYVFTTGRVGNKPLNGLSKAKVRIDRLMGDIPPWTNHDLRRTATTGMRALGHSRLVTDAITNHAIPGIAAVYDRYDQAPEKRAALEAWARHLIRLVNGDAAGDNVIELAGASQ